LKLLLNVFITALVTVEAETALQDMDSGEHLTIEDMTTTVSAYQGGHKGRDKKNKGTAPLQNAAEGSKSKNDKSAAKQKKSESGKRASVLDDVEDASDEEDDIEDEGLREKGRDVGKHRYGEADGDEDGEEDEDEDEDEDDDDDDDDDEDDDEDESDDGEDGEGKVGAGEAHIAATGKRKGHPMEEMPGKKRCDLVLVARASTFGIVGIPYSHLEFKRQARLSDFVRTCRAICCVYNRSQNSLKVS
jgi:hypothetical protein